MDVTPKDRVPLIRRSAFWAAEREAIEGNRLRQSHHIGMVGQLSGQLWDRLTAACSGLRTLGPRAVLSRAEDPLTHSAMLLDGIMVRYVAGVTPATAGQLMVALQVPGDFVDLHGLPLGHLDHDVRSLTTARLALFPHDALQEIMANSAEDARALWRLTMIDAAMHRHWTYRSGRLRALASVADFLCEMDLRMQMCGRVENGRFSLGMAQADLAEVSGLSTVHVSRVMKELRDAGLCTMRDGHVKISDRFGLRRIAGFGPGYLYLPPSPAVV